MLVFVSYALPDKQTVIELEVEPTCTVDQAIALSNITDKHPELKQHERVVGVYGKKVTSETQLAQFDRVEIYRPLLLTPIEARKLRAKQTAKSKT